MNKKIERLYTNLTSAAALAVLAMPSYSQQIIPGGSGWADSYSVDNTCYCDTSYDHGIGDYTVSTPAGIKTVREVCEAIGPGPGRGSNPIYNTVQCGHDPAHDDTGNFSYTDGTRRNVADEIECPGRVDLGPDGCDEIGPRWDLDSVFRGVQPTSLSLPGRIEAEDSTSQYGTRTQDTNDGGGGESVGHIEPGDNLSYLVDVETTGTYEIEFRVASPRSNTVMALSVNGSTVVDIDIPNTGGWENWTTITEEVFLNSGSQTIRFDFSGVNGGLMNINWFDAEQSESGAVELSNTNWRLSSFYNSEDVYNAIDGDTGSRWTTGQSQRYPQDLIIDLNETRSFDRIILDSAGSNNDQPRGYSVYVSDIAARWGSAVATGEGDVSGITTINFDDQTARYIRIVQTGSDSFHWWSIHELKVFSNSN